MPDQIQSALAWLADKQDSHASRTVTLKRGAELTLGVMALKASNDFGSDDDDTIIEDWQGRDWLIRPADYRINGVAVEPLRGDRIVEVDGGKTKTYEVMAPGGLPPFRETRSGTRYRVHTKLVEEQ